VKLAIGKDPEFPSALADIEDRPARSTVLPAEVEAIKAYIETNALR
jgi:hypothetical protein